MAPAQTDSIKSQRAGTRVGGETWGARGVCGKKVCGTQRERLIMFTCYTRNYCRMTRDNQG